MTQPSEAQPTDGKAQAESQQQNSEAGGSTSGYTPPATQEELNRIIDTRLTRERAKFADYEDLRAKAAQLQQLEQASMTEAEKTAERIAAADRAVQAVPQKVAEGLKGHLKALHKISDDDAELFLTATDPDVLLKQVDRLVARANDSKTNVNHVPREGTNPPPKNNSEREFVQGLFGGG